MRHRGLPNSLLVLIQKLYDDVVSTLRLGSAERALHIRCGVKQGCPLSATIFALAFDACVMMLIQAIGMPRIRIFAFADGLALLITWI